MQEPDRTRLWARLQPVAAPTGHQHLKADDSDLRLCTPHTGLARDAVTAVSGAGVNPVVTGSADFPAFARNRVGAGPHP
jgi:hypothetical protein